MISHKPHGNTKHGMANSPEYAIWCDIVKRTENPKFHHYLYYGGRGIKMCGRWRQSFEAFYEDMGPRPGPKHSINRIDNDGDYCPENCEWAIDVEQAHNKGLRRDNKTGIPGVYWVKRDRKYQAVISNNGKRLSLGAYDTLEEAKEARLRAQRELWES